MPKILNTAIFLSLSVPEITNQLGASNLNEYSRDRLHMLVDHERRIYKRLAIEHPHHTTLITEISKRATTNQEEERWRNTLILGT